MIIAIEGLDASGKDTVATAIAASIKGEVINFPNEKATVTGAPIRAYLREGWQVVSEQKIDGSGRLAGTFRDDAMSALAFQSMMIVNRLETLPRMMKLRDKGTPVVAVRYWQSGVVYGALDGLDPKWLADVQACMPRAHVNLLLDVDPAVAMVRRQRRDGAYPAERYEGKLEALAKVRAMYRALWHENDRPGNFAWKVIDANANIERVIAECKRAITASHMLA